MGAIHDAVAGVGSGLPHHSCYLLT